MIVYIYIYVRWTFMYYLTVDYLIPFHIQKNNEITKKEVQRGF